MTSQIPTKNELILFRKRKEPSFAIFNNIEGDKASIFSEEGKDISVDISKIAYCSEIIIEGNLTAAEKKLKLREFRNLLEARRENVDLKTLWECLENEEQEVSYTDLFNLYLGDSTISDEDRLIFFWAVDKNDTFFKRAETGYLVRQDSEVKELIAKKEIEERRIEERKQALVWAKNLVSGSTHEVAEDFDPESHIDLIKRYVIHLDKFSKSSDAKSFLSQVGIKDVEGAIEFLVKIGSWQEDEDPLIKRFSISSDFPKKVMHETNQILEDPFSEEGLEDLTHLEIFSVDDENTQDIDDGISIEETEDGTVIGVHITNVALYIQKWSALDDEAARRGETIYLPEHNIHMFPKELIKEKLSLVKGSMRKALSLLVSFDKNLNLKSYRFTNSKINLVDNLSYTKAVDYFESDPLGIKMNQIAQNLRSTRKDSGAFIIQLPQLKITVTENSKIEVRKNYMDTIAHRVNAEFMILMNHMAGKYLKDNEIPGIYRSQPEPISQDAWSHDPNDPLFALHVVKYLRAPRVGLDPAPHMSLGIDVYAQATSPIRRYTDLIIQRQIVSTLQGDEPTYTEDELENLYPRIEIGVRDKRMVERSREKYWLYKHLKSLEGKELPGIISSLNNSRATVYLTDYLFEAPVFLGSRFNIDETKNINLVVQEVDPLRRKLILAPKL